MKKVAQIKGLVLACVLLVTGGAGLAWAQEKTPPLPEPLQKLAAEGAQMRYLGRDLGFDGWVSVKNGQEQYFYVAPDTGTFFLGLLFNKNGRAVTFDQIKRLQGKGDPLFNPAEAPSQKAEMKDETAPVTSKVLSPAERLFQAAEGAQGIKLGADTAPVVYMFIDPQCPHCKDFLKDLRKDYIESGRLQVRIIPVGVLGDKSLKMAASLLTFPDAGARLWRLIDGDESAVPADPAADTRPVAANIKIMQDWKLTATPLTLYRDKTGKIKLIQGRAKNPEDMMQDLR